MRPRLRFLLLFVLLVLKFTIIHYLCHRRHCIRGDLDEIHTERLCFDERLREGKYPQHLARLRDNTEFLGADLMVDFRLGIQWI